MAAGSAPVGRRRRAQRLGRGRRVGGWALAVAAPALLTAAFLPAGQGPAATTLNFLCHLTGVVFVALVGGWWPAVTAALLGTLALNWFFTPPTGQWHIHEPLNVAALGLFLLVAAGVARVVDIEARRTAEAQRARRQADVLSDLAGSVIREELGVTALLERLCTTCDLAGVALAARAAGRADGSAEGSPAGRADGGADGGPGGGAEGAGGVAEAAGAGAVLASAGERLPDARHCDRVLTVDEDHVLLVDGATPGAADQGVLEAFASRIAVVLQQRQLAEARWRAEELAAANAIRTALLAAVSHDLRTPLAGIKASVSSLRLRDVVLSPEDTAELLATIEESADRLSERVEDLLSMGRIQAGDLVVHRTPLEVEDLLSAAVHDLGAHPGRSRVRVEVVPGCPAVVGDNGLAVRVLANLVENALKHGGTGPVLVQAVPGPGGVQLRVIDHGPGVPGPDRERIFRPFQRLGDRDPSTGLGLGLAVARGLAEGMGGTVHAADTPGGGTTMVLTLPSAEEAA
ncbi:ATP-binding protein [Citricoccus sp. SGAir0253]|uniref:sensor histidine kinase n=1 Tax=Citricoccus sp. SGAir0253 TaxID=2567881 RepID=UPI00143D70EF|nr:ATP-binding protein [Citricoccus sp. SGAir0253]